MPKKVVETTIGSTSIKFENTWFGGAKLFVDGELLVKDNSPFVLDKHSPLIAKKVMVEGVEHLIEVFAYALFTVNVKLHVDGSFVAGDQF